MPTISGKLIIDKDNKLCVKTQISPQNPTLYDVPLEELFESYIDKDVHVDIWPVEIRLKKGGK
nr:hypothetical protein [Candidatus Sigynarchaeota archaeon]